MLRPASGSVPSLWAHLFRCSSPHVDTTITACCTAETRLKRCSPAPSKGCGVGRSPGRCSEQLWWCSSTSLAAGCHREKGCHAGQHPSSSWEAFAWQLACSLQLLAARWWLSCPLSPPTRPSSKQPLLLPAPGRRGWLGHCAKVNIYIAGAFLPLPWIFSPFLKCHRSAVFIIGQEMSSLLAGSLTPSCTTAPTSASAACPHVHPASSGGRIWLGRRRKQAWSSTTTQHC